MDILKSAGVIYESGPSGGVSANAKTSLFSVADLNTYTFRGTSVSMLIRASLAQSPILPMNALNDYSGRGGCTIGGAIQSSDPAR
jgi:hypothetical protein